MCPDFCVNDQVLFLGMGCRGRGVPLPLPIDVEAFCAFHDAILSRAGIRSGHRMVKWFRASRQ